MSKLNRRGFLKTGIVGAAGVMTFSSVLASEPSKSQEKKILYRTLGKTGIKVPVVSCGASSFVPNLCKAAYDNGITLFDTASAYANGNNEKLLGNVFKGIPRNSFIIQTKIKILKPGKDDPTLPSDKKTAEDFLAKFNDSLSRLQMDYVDILLIHEVSDPNVLKNKPLVRALQKLKKDGKTRFIGISTHAITSVINAAASVDIWDVILTTYNFKMSNIDELNASIKKANDAGIGIIAMKTLAGGSFLDKEKTKPLNTAAALKWALANPYIHTSILGMTNFDQLNLNLKVLEDITLTDQEKKDILIASAEPGLFCSGCDNCVPACPFNLPVPDLMRAYMYAYGYSDTSKAYNLLGELGTGSAPCSNCEICKIECRRNFNIKEKIADISRLVNVPVDFIG
jgi:predicted aldo/keto reductase-like oxidoreductase